MNVLVSWNAIITSSIIWSVLQNAVKGDLKEFQRWLRRTQKPVNLIVLPK